MSGQEKKRNGLSRALRTFYGVGDCGYTLTTNVESYFFQLLPYQHGTVLHGAPSPSSPP